ncbi:hypothetical protein F7725_004554 [Dissostichus mawsoni]|uniref:Arf-GAP domain-containing protein n=1 Tax=Dissostichus mawsoni TaxID=36200 RepID=A0A7J5XJD6_DISMA|nr:hypothetical protein F7725_004554 [Dissostichus mawsoni]
MSNRKHRDNQEICARKVRELAQSGVNKHCFECKPGVTYTDITVGSFVCTSCSGMLRGLNPPHRVKSISMTTFSQQEVEFLQNHGNEVGRRTWLCVFDPKTDSCPDMKDSQKFKEFLQDKFEKKKWHFSKSKNRRDVEGPWSPGVQAVPPSHGPLASQAPSHNLPPNARSTRPLSQSQLPLWDRAPAISPADMRTDAFTARPSRSRASETPLSKKDSGRGPSRQRLELRATFPLSPPSRGPQVCPAMFSIPLWFQSIVRYRPQDHWAIQGLPKSLSVDFGGLNHPQQHSLPHSMSQQQPGNAGQATTQAGNSNPSDRYAAVSHLDSVLCEPPTVAAPPAGPPQYNALFGNRLSSSSTPASSPVSKQSPAPKHFPNPFSSSSASQQPVALSPSNPFSSSSGGDSGEFVTSPTPVFPPSASYPALNTQNAFHHESASNQESNGFASFPAPDSQPKVPRPMSVNPFTGNVYASRGTSRNPFI